MHLNQNQLQKLDHFFNSSKFSTEGAVITDLDGTAVHEHDGKTIIHDHVKYGLEKLYELGRPVVINTLRFPLSIIRTFGLEWYQISNMPIPVILLNGSQLGIIKKEGDEFLFEQLEAFPLEQSDIEVTIKQVKELVNSGIHDIILFYYPEDWTKGEIIWTPVREKIPFLQQKYKSASSVISNAAEELHEMLIKQSICMIFLLIEIPGDKLMAYQHTRKNNFITRKGVDKLFGIEQMSRHLNFSLPDSIGAGDSPMDVFLNGVGLSIHVANKELPFSGTRDTIRLDNFFEFGDLLYRCADRQEVETR